MISMARTFGAPDTVPAGKHATSASSRSQRSDNCPSHDRYQVHHVRISLERHIRRHLHRAVCRHAPEIVAPQIDEHHVFGAFLLVALQLLSQPGVVFLSRPSRPRAGDRVRFDSASLDANEHFGRRADDCALPHAKEIHVR